MLMPDDSFMKNPKHVARLGRQKILSENMVVTDLPSVYLQSVIGQNTMPHMALSQLLGSRHK